MHIIDSEHKEERSVVMERPHWGNCLLFGVVSGLLGLLCYYYWNSGWGKTLLPLLGVANAILSLFMLASGAPPSVIFWILFWNCFCFIIVGLLIGEPAWKKEQTKSIKEAENLRQVVSITETIKGLNTAIDLDPKNAVGYNNRGVAKENLGDHTGAIKDFNKAIELNSKYAEAYFCRGKVKYSLDDKQGALKDLSEAGDLGYSAAYLTIALYNKGFTKGEFLDFAEGIKGYTKTIELNPKDVLAYYNRGCAKGKLGDFTGSIKDFNTVIELDSKNAEAFYNRGGAKADLKDYTEAIKDFNTAIELDPKYAKAYYNRGCTKGKSGDRTGALEDLSRAGELGYSRAYAKIKEIQGQ